MQQWYPWCGWELTAVKHFLLFFLNNFELFLKFFVLPEPQHLKKVDCYWLQKSMCLSEEVQEYFNKQKRRNTRSAVSPTTGTLHFDIFISWIIKTSTMGKIKSIQKKNNSDGKSDINNKPNDLTTRIMKFAFQTPANKTKYNTYATVRDRITNLIQWDYEDGKR